MPGFPCRLYRNLIVGGTWCGYVGVPVGHPWWGKEYGKCAATPPCAEDDGRCRHCLDVLVEVHGGLTYSGFHPGPPCRSAVRDHWWFGFDCNHAWDLAPAMEALIFHLEVQRGPLDRGPIDADAPLRPLASTYRTLPEVIEQTQALAEQLALAAMSLLSALVAI